MKRIVGGFCFSIFLALVSGCDPAEISQGEAVALAEGTVGGNAVYFYTLYPNDSNHHYTAVLVCKGVELHFVLVDDAGDVEVLKKDQVDPSLVRCVQ